MNLGNANMLRGALVEALAMKNQAIAIDRELGDRPNEGMALGNVALLHTIAGNVSEAFSCYEQALAIHRETGNRRFEACELGNLGSLVYELGNLAAAAQHLEEAVKLGDEMWPVAAGAFRGWLALVRADQGQTEEAKALLDEGALQLRGRHPIEYGKLICKQARVQQIAGEYGAAAASLAQAEIIAKDIETTPESELGRELSKAQKALARQQ
jgi:tetratricopeptide (TPR) repeat protein